MSRAALQIAHHAAGLAHQHDARRHVPGLEAPFPEAVKAAGRDIGHVQRGGAHAADAGETFITAVSFGQGACMASRPRKGRPMAKSDGASSFRAGHAQPLVVEIGAMAFLGHKKHRR